MTDNRVTFCEDEHGVIDEIVMTSVDVHIERMNDTDYWMCIGGKIFWASTKKRGRLIITPEG